MGGNDQDGYYCTICGGIPPDKINIRQIPVDGKATGIDKLDWILAEVRKLNLSNDTVITEELLKRTKVLNYVPTRKEKEYGDALLLEYKKTGGVTGARSLSGCREPQDPDPLDKKVPAMRQRG